MRSCVSAIFIFVIVTRCATVTPGNGYRNGYSNGRDLDIEELARQNRITQQILEHYLEKRLFPAVRAPSRPPTVWEILPKPKRPDDNIQDLIGEKRQTPETETLQSVESEQVPVYGDEDGDDDEKDALADGTEGTFVLGLRNKKWID